MSKFLLLKLSRNYSGVCFPQPRFNLKDKRIMVRIVKNCILRIFDLRNKIYINILTESNVIGISFSIFLKSIPKVNSFETQSCKSLYCI